MENIKIKSSDQFKKNRRFSRRVFLFLLVVIIAGYIYFYRKPPRKETKKKFIILGFDGADPRFVEQWWDELPNLRRLADQGTYSRLRSSTPPESPVAWASFAVGANPGEHGVYDFLRRPVGSYIPTEESFVGREFPKFIFGGIPIKMPKAVSLRGGTAFWDVLSKHGIETSMLEVPTTFPPPKMNYGYTLSGLGVPDCRGVQATFHHFLYGPDFEPTETTFGGKIVELKQNEKDVELLEGHVFGPYDPIIDQEIRSLEKKILEKRLTWCEWQAHLNRIRREHVTEEEKYNLKKIVGTQIVQSLALFSYLRSEETSKRLNALQESIEKDIPFVKEEGVRASVARTHMAELSKELNDLDDKIEEIKKTIFNKVAFKVIDDETVEIRLRGQVQQTKLKKWSDWFRLEFPVTKFIAVHGICRFYPQELSNGKISIFMSSPDIDPTNPPVPISHPKSFSKDLVEWTDGLFKTRGWAAETHGLKDGHLSEEGFMDDLLDLMKKREEKTFATWNKSNSNVFISVFSETDRVSHMFIHHMDEKHPMHKVENAAKYKDEIKKVFLRMDEIVGRMMKEIENDPDTVLVVMSDHGFQSWRHQVNINKWLVDNGYMALQGNPLMDSEMKLDDLLKKNVNSYFSYVDWSKTKAYALGLGQIYINLKGREPLGIVEKKDYNALCDEICTKLNALNDDREGMEGAQVVSFVGKRGDIWTGRYADDDHDAPDLQVCFSEHYRVSWQTCLGGISPTVLEPNMEKWSGCHCSFDPKHVPGIFFCNRKINTDNPSIFDFAPTVLNYFDLKAPSRVDGKNIL